MLYTLKQIATKPRYMKRYLKLAAVITLITIYLIDVSLRLHGTGTSWATVNDLKISYLSSRVDNLVNTLAQPANSRDSLPPVVDGAVYSTRFKYLINTPKDNCRRSMFSLFIYIHSAVGHFERRDTLRKTWANVALLKRLNIGIVFIIGTSSNITIMGRVSRESEEYSDIVQIDYPDSYHEITVKAVASLHWVNTYCAPFVTTLLKCDDDIFVHILRLVQYTQDSLPGVISTKGNKVIVCLFRQHDTPVRDKSDKWYVPEAMYPYPEYPPYCQGSAYIITPHAVTSLSRVLVAADIYVYDDVFITGFATAVARVALHGIKKRYLETFVNPPRKITNKDLESNFIFAHCTLDKIHELWKLTSHL